MALRLPVATCHVEASQLPDSALALLQEQNWCSWLESPPGFRMLLQRSSERPCNLKSDYGLKFLCLTSRAPEGFCLVVKGRILPETSGHALLSLFIPACSHLLVCSLFHSFARGNGFGGHVESQFYLLPVGWPWEVTNLTEPCFLLVKMGDQECSLAGWIK